MGLIHSLNRSKTSYKWKFAIYPVYLIWTEIWVIVSLFEYPLIIKRITIYEALGFMWKLYAILFNKSWQYHHVINIRVSMLKLSSLSLRVVGTITNQFLYSKLSWWHPASEWQNSTLNPTIPGFSPVLSVIELRETL